MNLSLRKEDQFHLCFPARCGIHHLCFSSLWLCITFFTGYIPRVQVMILLPRAQMISELCALYPKLHLSTQRPSPALWSVCSYLPSTEKWIAYRNFSSFFSNFHPSLSIVCSTYNYKVTLGTGFKVVSRTDLVVPHAAKIPGKYS